MKDSIMIIVVILSIIILFFSVGCVIVSIVIFNPVVIVEGLIGVWLSSKFLMWYID
jgi:hypothetical protein